MTVDIFDVHRVMQVTTISPLSITLNKNTVDRAVIATHIYACLQAPERSRTSAD